MLYANMLMLEDTKYILYKYLESINSINSTHSSYEQQDQRTNIK